MAKVNAHMEMSLDGFIADPNDGIEQLFVWYFSGEVTVPTASSQMPPFQTDAASAEVLRDALANTGALIAGRRLFDIAGGWGGTHPLGVPVFVVTHRVPDGWPRDDAPFTFVTDGVEQAVAQAKTVAGDKTVTVASPNIAQQCLNAGLLEEVVVSLVPVLLGEGIRFFDHLKDTPVQLEGPRVVEGTGVAHLSYLVQSR